MVQIFKFIKNEILYKYYLLQIKLCIKRMYKKLHSTHLLNKFFYYIY